MAFPVTLNGRTYTLTDFEGTNYVDGLPDAFEDFVTHAGDIYNSTSTTSNSIGTGSKTFTVEANKPYQAGTPLRIADAAAPSTNFLDTVVTSYSGTTLVVNSIGFGGSGTKTSWTVNIGGAKTVDGTLGLSQGGTGATDAAGARTNIDVYSKADADSRFLNVSGEASDVVITGDLTVNTNTLFVDGANSRVGIGTTSPQTSLHIQQTSATAVLRLHRTGATNAADAELGQIEFFNADGSNDGPNVVAKITGSTHGSSGSGGNLRFFTHDGSEGGEGSDPIEVGRFEGSGNLLVGQTSLNYNTIGGSLSAGGTLRVCSDSYNAATFNRKTSDGDIAIFYKDGATVGSIGTLTDDLSIGNLDTGLIFQGAGDRISPFNPATNSYRDAAIDLGKDDRRFKDLFLSGGVYLGGTGSANKLDDVETGTFTPTVHAHNGSMTATYITENTYGRYTKIGQLVSFDLEVRTSTISGANNGFLRIGGLPFPSPSNFHQPVFALSIYRVTFNTSSIYTAEFTGASSNVLYIRESRSNNTSSEMPSSAWSAANPTLIRISGSYRTS